MQRDPRVERGAGVCGGVATVIDNECKGERGTL